MVIPDPVVMISSSAFMGVVGWLIAEVRHASGNGKDLAVLKTEMVGVRADVTEIKRRVFNGHGTVSRGGGSGNP